MTKSVSSSGILITSGTTAHVAVRPEKSEPALKPALHRFQSYPARAPPRPPSWRRSERAIGRFQDAKCPTTLVSRHSQTMTTVSGSATHHTSPTPPAASPTPAPQRRRQ
jgi:hypothetical protein